MVEIKTERIKYVEIAKDIYAAITPACGLDITDAGMMDNFSNSAYINRGEGLVCDTFFDLPHAQDLKDFCIQKSGHAPKYVINTHGHWDHFWGNQVFDGATVIGHKDMIKDCADDQKKVGVFRFLYRSNALQNLLTSIVTMVFKKYLLAGKKAKVVVKLTDHDFDLTGVKPQLPNELFDENITLDLDGTQVQIINLGAIHSSSDTVVWIPSEKVLFAGDIFADCSSPLSMEAWPKWLAVLDYILDELQPEYIVPGHGEVYDRARAENQREYFKSLWGQFHEHYTPDSKADDLLKKIDVRKYIDHRPRLGWIMAVNGMHGAMKKK